MKRGMDVRRFGFQSWDDGTRLYRASRGPAILCPILLPSLGTMSALVWCSNQPNPLDSTLSFACTSASQPTDRPPSFSSSFCSFAHHFLLRLLLLLRRFLLVLLLLQPLLSLLLLLLLPLLLLYFILSLRLLLLLLLLLPPLLPLLLCHPRPVTRCYLRRAVVLRFFLLPPLLVLLCLVLRPFKPSPAHHSPRATAKAMHTHTHAPNTSRLLLLVLVIGVVRAFRSNSQPRPILMPSSSVKTLRGRL